MKWLWYDDDYLSSSSEEGRTASPAWPWEVKKSRFGKHVPSNNGWEIYSTQHSEEWQRSHRWHDHRLQYQYSRILGKECSMKKHRSPKMLSTVWWEEGWGGGLKQGVKEYRKANKRVHSIIYIEITSIIQWLWVRVTRDHVHVYIHNLLMVFMW